MKKSVLLAVLIPLAIVSSVLWLIAWHSKVHSRPWERSGVPEADWKDDRAWRSTPEYKAVMNELMVVANAADARGGPTADEVEVLINYMNSPHSFAREMAVIAAETARSDPARSLLMPRVLALLSDPVSFVRLSAAGSLERMGDKNAIPFLHPLLNDNHPVVAKAAQRAILKLQEKETTTEK